MKIKRDIIEAKYTLSDISQEDFRKLRDALQSLIHYFTFRERLEDSRNPLVEAPEWLLNILQEIDSTPPTK